MDETMVSRRASPLLLQAIFFTMQNVSIPFQNPSTKLWNSTRNEVTKGTTKQMQHKFKLEETKNNVLKKT